MWVPIRLLITVSPVHFIRRYITESIFTTFCVSEWWSFTSWYFNKKYRAISFLTACTILSYFWIWFLGALLIHMHWFHDLSEIYSGKLYTCHVIVTYHFHAYICLIFLFINFKHSSEVLERLDKTMLEIKLWVLTFSTLIIY